MGENATIKENIEKWSGKRRRTRIHAEFLFGKVKIICSRKYLSSYDINSKFFQLVMDPLFKQQIAADHALFLMF